MKSRRTLQNIILSSLLFAAVSNGWSQPVNTIIAERRSPAARIIYPSTVKVEGYTIDGYVKVTGSTRFIFPISDNGQYRPVAASADGTMAAYFAANPSIAITSKATGGNYGPLPAGAPFPISSKDATVAKVSDKEYWDINGVNLTKITLTWTAESAIGELVNNGSLSRLYIVAWNGSKWIKLPSKFDATSLMGGASTLTAGSITTTSTHKPGTYNVYTFGADPAPPAPAQSLRIASAAEDSQEEIETDISVYPNPVTSRFFVKANKTISQISLMSSDGRQYIKEVEVPKDGIDVSHLSPGIYILWIIEKDGEIVTKKIVIGR